MTEIIITIAACIAALVVLYFAIVLIATVFAARAFRKAEREIAERRSRRLSSDPFGRNR